VRNVNHASPGARVLTFSTYAVHNVNGTFVSRRAVDEMHRQIGPAALNARR